MMAGRNVVFFLFSNTLFPERHNAQNLSRRDVSVFILIGASRGAAGIQQITVQVGALGNPVAGTALPVKVVVDGVQSNIDKTFTPNPGPGSGGQPNRFSGGFIHQFRYRIAFKTFFVVR
jgi:hypothetical protein